jgi:hypothetical protein
MPQPSPFEVLVYDKNREYQGVLPALPQASFTPRHNQQDSGVIVLPASHPAALDLANIGSHVVVYHKGEFLLSGACRLLTSQGLGSRQMLEFQVQGHWRLFANILGWQVPTGTYTPGTVDQSAKEYDVRTGPAETVFKGFVSANAARLGLPVTVEPSEGRGDTVTVQSRMHSLADRLFPVVDQAGIGTRIRLDGGVYHVEAYEPRTLPGVIDATGGVLSDLVWTRVPPEATRAVVQGPGDGTARLHRLVVDSALEAEWGDVIEVAVDARDLDEEDPNLHALMEARGHERLAENSTAYGIQIVVQQGRGFDYSTAPGGVVVGDRMKVELVPGSDPVVDVLRSATLSYDRRTGPRFVPQVGEQSQHPIQGLYRGVAQALKALRNYGSRN